MSCLFLPLGLAAGSQGPRNFLLVQIGWRNEHSRSRGAVIQLLGIGPR
jgi:hypothetical protein